jgi:predicted secreted protein
LRVRRSHDVLANWRDRSPHHHRRDPASPDRRDVLLKEFNNDYYRSQRSRAPCAQSTSDQQYEDWKELAFLYLSEKEIAALEDKLADE